MTVAVSQRRPGKGVVQTHIQKCPKDAHFLSVADTFSQTWNEFFANTDLDKIFDNDLIMLYDRVVFAATASAYATIV